MAKQGKNTRHNRMPADPIVHATQKRTAPPRISVTNYTKKRVQEKKKASARECIAFREKPGVTWINVDGVHSSKTIREIGESFGLHPLVLEDIENTGQRPKMEEHEGYLYACVKMLYYVGEKGRINFEQVSLVIGKGFVLSFQEKPGDVFNPIRERIRNGKGKLRSMGADYLGYALLDAVVDSYFAVLEKFGEMIEAVEESVVKSPSPKTLRNIHRLKHEIIFLRKSVWPLREVISSLERSGSSLVKKETLVYLRDLYGHAVQVIDTIETFREMVSGMLDVYLSSVSNRMNEVMKVLTVIATIFIPLTFITGIYGMNFRNMPELEWKFGYSAALLLMAAVGVAMAMYFRKKKWL